MGGVRKYCRQLAIGASLRECSSDAHELQGSHIQRSGPVRAARLITDPSIAITPTLCELYIGPRITMRIPSFAQLSSFIRRVLGFHMPSPFDDVFDSRFSDLPQEVDPVLSVYIRARGNEISDPDGTHSDTPSPRIRDVWLKKCLPSVAEHEYLVAAIVTGKRPWANDDVIGHLKIERAYDPIHGNKFVWQLGIPSPRSIRSVVCDDSVHATSHETSVHPGRRAAAQWVEPWLSVGRQ